MLRISKFGIMLVAMTGVPSAYATDVVPVEDQSANQNLVAAVQASDTVAPVTAAFANNEKAQVFSGSVKHDLSPALKAVKEKYQIPGSDLNMPRSGLLNLLIGEICIKDHKETALLVQERKSLKQACNALIAHIQNTGYPINVSKVTNLTLLSKLREVGAIYNSVINSNIEEISLSKGQEVANAFLTEINETNDPETWNALPYEVKQQMALIICEDRIATAKMLNCYAHLLNSQSTGVEPATPVAGLGMSSFKILHDFFMVKEARAFFKYNLVLSRSLAGVSPESKAIQKPYSLYGLEALPYFEAAKVAAAEEKAPVLEEPIVVANDKEKQEAVGEEDAFDNKTMLQKIEHLNWVEPDEAKRQQHALNLYSLYKHLRVIIQEDLLSKIDSKFMLKVQAGDGALLDARGMAQVMLDYVTIREAKWQARTPVDSIEFKLGLSDIKLPNIKDALAYYKGLIPAKSAEIK